MNSTYQKVKGYLTQLNFEITKENSTENILVIQKENSGIKNLIIGVADPILILEQFIFQPKNPSLGMYQNLLQKNRDIIHGAFVLNDTGDKVIFRDTLQTANLDINELEASLNSLGILLSEFADEIINYSQQ